MRTAAGRKAETHVLGESDVDGIEGHDQIFGAIHLLEGRDDSGFATRRAQESAKDHDGLKRNAPSNLPNEVLVGSRVVYSHSLLVDQGHLVHVDRRGVSSLVSHLTGIGGK